MKTQSKFGGSLIMGLQSFRSNKNILRLDRENFEKETIGRSKRLTQKSRIQNKKDSYRNVKLHRIGEEW